MSDTSYEIATYNRLPMTDSMKPLRFILRQF